MIAAKPLPVTLLQTGFRPFFALAGLGAGGLMLVWMAVFHFASLGISPSYPPVAWHAHEMIFGFGMATVAGFLLTAVRNWTGRQTLQGPGLLLLALLWVLARVLPLLPGINPWVGAGVEGLFLAGLLVAVLHPIVAVRQWRQMGIVAKLVLMLPASLAFHAGVAGVWAAGTNLGLYMGFYLLLSLVLTLARRVMPMFIERGLMNGFMPKNSVLLDRLCLTVFLLFAVADTGFQQIPESALLQGVVPLLALLLVGLHATRLHGWYHKAIWQKPMVWILVVAYAWIITGFLLMALNGLGWGSHSLALHALAVGGMGLVIVGMMSRVSLGHTGRNPNSPPAGLVPVFVLILLAAVFRVFGPWLVPSQYLHWIALGQLFWVLGFLGFAFLFVPLLLRPRVDGQPG